jgi:hypothetical protein
MRDTLNIDWPSSRFTVARFTKTAFEYEYQRDREFWIRQTQGRSSDLEGLLSSLGQPSMGLTDFPRVLQLSIPRIERQLTANKREPNLVSAVLLPEFYDQLTDQVEGYVEGYRSRNHDQDPYIPTSNVFRTEINTLRALSRKAYDRLIWVTFESFRGEFEYTIKGITTDAYSPR